MNESCCCCCDTQPAACPGHGQYWVEEEIRTPNGCSVSRVSTSLKFKDRMGAFRARISTFRMKYTVEPGLYAVGTPGPMSPVCVGANYKLSFDALRRALAGIDAWILILDTKGINVWCAAGKGTFGTGELVNRIRKCKLDAVVTHRSLIVPQLGAVGVTAHDVTKETGFRVHFGPVQASDLPQYFRSDMKATPEMRRVAFTLRDRLVLVPMELRPAVVSSFPWAVLFFVLSGLMPQGFMFHEMFRYGVSLGILWLGAVIAGSIFTPLLLPVIPFRAFSIKGWLAGIVSTAVLLPMTGIDNLWLIAGSMIFFPALSSWFALNFTGSTPYTGMSGVKKEMRFAVPLYMVATGIAAVLFIIFKIRSW